VHKTLLPLLAFAAASGPAAHAAFDPAIVSADARWVVYADLDVLRQSAVGKEFIAEVGRRAAVHPVMLPGSTITIDVPKLLATIGSVTGYGANFVKDPKLLDATLVVQGTPDLRKIVEAILIEMNVGKPASAVELHDLGYSAYRLTAPGKAPGGHTVVIAFPTDRTVVVSPSEDQVRRTAALLAGGGASLAQASDSALGALLPNAAGATVFAASVMPPAENFPQQDGPQTRLLQMTQSASVALGEEGPKTFAHIRLVATSDDAADKLVKILQGMTAMMSLAQTNDRQLAAFLNSSQASRDGERVNFQLSYASVELAQMIHRMTAEPPRNFHREMPGQPPNPERFLGKEVASWSVTAPESPAPGGTAAPAPAAAWHTIPNVALVNGSQITLRVTLPRTDSRVPFDRLQIVPAGGGAPLTFSRRLLTKVRHPPAPANARPYRLLRFGFPGEDGTYSLRVHVTPPAAGDAAFAVWVKNDFSADSRPGS
jgi:hypothetical protein